MSLEDNEIKRIWKEFVKLSTFETDHGREKLKDYLERIDDYESINPAPWPAMESFDVVANKVFELAVSSISPEIEPEKVNGEQLITALRKKYMHIVRSTQDTTISFIIHPGLVASRKGKAEIKAQMSSEIDHHMKKLDVEKMREFYFTWTWPGPQRLPYELERYLEIAKGLRRNLAKEELSKIRDKYVPSESRGDATALGRDIRYAKRILANVSQGHFPGDYRD